MLQFVLYSIIFTVVFMTGSVMAGFAVVKLMTTKWFMKKYFKMVEEMAKHMASIDV